MNHNRAPVAAVEDAEELASDRQAGSQLIMQNVVCVCMWQLCMWRLGLTKDKS